MEKSTCWSSQYNTLGLRWDFHKYQRLGRRPSLLFIVKKSINIKLYKQSCGEIIEIHPRFSYKNQVWFVCINESLKRESRGDRGHTSYIPINTLHEEGFEGLDMHLILFLILSYVSYFLFIWRNSLETIIKKGIISLRFIFNHLGHISPRFFQNLFDFSLPYSTIAWDLVLFLPFVWHPKIHYQSCLHFS